MDMALCGCSNRAGDYYLPSPLPCELSQVTLVRGWWGLGRGAFLPPALTLTPVGSIQLHPQIQSPAGKGSYRMWLVWVFRVFLVTVTQNQSTSYQTRCSWSLVYDAGLGSGTEKRGCGSGP